MSEAIRRWPDLLKKIETESDSLHASRGTRIFGYFINFFQFIFRPCQPRSFRSLDVNAHTDIFQSYGSIDPQREMKIKIKIKKRKKKTFLTLDSGNYDTHLSYSGGNGLIRSPGHTYGHRVPEVVRDLQRPWGVSVFCRYPSNPGCGG